jgi:hypothetical protein
VVFKFRWSVNEGLNYIKCTTMGNENEGPFKMVFKYRWSFNEGLTYIKYTAMGNENEDPFNTGGLLKKV